MGALRLEEISFPFACEMTLEGLKTAMAAVQSPFASGRSRNDDASGFALVLY